jgi:hypothetical protein
MSKANDVSRELTIDEMDAVSGGAGGETFPDDVPWCPRSLWGACYGNGGGGVSDDTMIRYGRGVAGAA